jgi:hypothetical protein
MLRRVITRNYVGLAFNQQQKTETVDRSLKSFQHVVNGPTDTISQVGKGICKKKLFKRKIIIENIV